MRTHLGPFCRIAQIEEKSQTLPMNVHHFQIRDPIHGIIFISQEERAVIDSAVFQRLRNIKQVGFADFAFPCATHSRYSHSLGAMSVASKIYERVIPKESMSSADWLRLRQGVRLAALLHDIGHPPLSHTTEMLMPSLSLVNPHAKSHRQATHEDFTLKLITDSSLSKVLDDNFANVGLSPSLIANLVMDSQEENCFVVDGLDYAPIMHQIISSEMDADRMDYLLRDSFFCGVNYGKFDSDWLINNLIAHQDKRQVFLGLKARAIFAFEDFLLSRYHMFASVYLHHTPVIMEKMLERFFIECPESFSLPADIERYIELDDADLWQTLKKSSNQWARRIVERRPYIRLEESFASSASLNYDDAIDALRQAQIDAILSRSKSVLSTYRNIVKYPIFVEATQKHVVPLEEYSQLFVRYQAPAELVRIFVDASDKDRSLVIVRDMFENHSCAQERPIVSGSAVL